MLTDIFQVFLERRTTAIAITFALVLSVVFVSMTVHGQTEESSIQSIVYHQITDIQNRETIPNILRMKVSADGSKVIFATSTKKIFTVNPDGTNFIQVFDYQAFRTGPPFITPFIDISADGSTIIWTDGVGEIFVANSDGTNQQRIATEIPTPTGGTVGPDLRIRPRITFDGGQVYFTNVSGGAEVAGVWRVNADGSGLTQLFSYREMSQQLFDMDGSEFNGNLAFRQEFDISDDGSRLVFGTFNFKSEGHTITYDGLRLRILTEFAPHDDDALAISGDGSKVVLTQMNFDLGRAPVHSINFDGSNRIEILSDIGQSGKLERMTRDGAKVIAQGNVPITLLNTDGTGRVDLVTAPCLGYRAQGWDRAPFNRAGIGPTVDITADGGRFVFTSEPLGGNIPQIWVADINPDSTDGAPSISDVTLSPNYVLTDGSTASTFSAKVTGGDDGPPKTCFETFKEGVYQGADVLVNHVMFDNGTNGDVTAGDGVYTIEGVRGERIEPGEYAIRMHAAVPRHVMAIHAGPLTVSTEPICYTLTLSHTGSGSDPVTTPNKSSGCGQVGEFVVNESITLTANPAAGWAVSNWRGTDDDSSMASSNTLTMPAADHTVQVVYQGMETPTVVPIATPPSVQSNADTFESDNSCAEARTITPNGTRQEHSFHNEGDTDWLRFDAESGQKYRIEVQTRANSRADVTLEVYSECGGSLESKFEETFTPGVRLDLSSTSNTTLYLKIFNFDPKVFGAEAVYSVSVTQRQSNKGAVILLEGRLKMNDRLQSNIHNVIQRAYHLFKDNGYSDDEIYYMGFDPSASGYDAAASSTNLQTAITTWAQDKVGPNNPLTIYLMDHGGLDNFYVDEPNGVRLRPQDLDAWLTELQTKKPGLKINVIIEACNSGSFIDGDESISGEDRLIITSTNAKNVAYASAEGAQFSDRFLTSLREGYGMSNSFWDAQFSVNRLYSLQQPWIDANGNGIPNEAADGGKVTSDHNPATDNLPADTWAPYIVKVEGPQVIANGTGTLRAEVRDNKSVKKVWATVYAPSAELPTRAEELVPEDVPIIDFQTLGSDLFSGTFDDFTEVGTYQIAFYAEDNDGLKARLAVLEVGMGTTIYLPLVDR